MIQRRLAGALAGLTLLCSGTSAFAYCRTTTCDGRKEDCGVIGLCPTKGQPLYWASKCASFSVQKDGSKTRNISYEQALDTITNGFLAWINADCGEGTFPSISIATSDQTSCTKQEYNQNSGNANTWMFRDEEWPYEGTSATLALTTLTFSIATGEIYDADVEINSFDKNLTVGDTDVGADLQSIVTHEAGHFLGLAHSPERSATMWASYDNGETSLRTLAADDMAGVCDIYPPGPAADRNQCVPRHGFSPYCGSSTDDTGCAASATHPAAASRTSLLWILGLFTGAAAALLRSRRSPRRS